MRQIYKKITVFWDSKKAAVIVGILFLLSLFPILYVGMYNFPSGDDYWYGVHTYRGWVESGILGALKGSFQTIAEFYQSWQGTWFTIFLFTLCPSHFVEGSYWITMFISLGLTIGSFAYLADYYLVKKLNFTRGAAASMVCMISYLGIQYLRRATSGIYWFNGVMHYCVPFFLGTLAVVHTHKFVEEKRKKDFWILFIAFTLLGGGSYLAPVIATLAAVLILFCQLEVKEFDWKNRKFQFGFDRRNLWILLALAAEMIGLVISFLSPGNSVRGTEEFGFDLKWALQCIYYAIGRGIYLGEDYFLKNGVTTMMYVLFFFILWGQLWRCDREKIKFRYPLFFVIYLNGIYWASYTPEIYSRSDVSGGVHNTYLHIFLIITLGCMICVHGWVQDRFLAYWKKKALKTGTEYETLREKSIFYGKKYETYVMFPALAVGAVVLGCVMYFSEVPTTNDACVEYAASGRMEQYVEVRKEQHRILSDESIEHAVIPEMGEQYPLLHMHLQEYPTDSRNIDRALYYGKKSVVAYMVE